MSDSCPGAESATVDDGKLEYLLVLDQGKAASFAKLGFNTTNSDELRELILAQLPSAPVVESRSNAGGGTNHAVRMTIEGPEGAADFRTVWSTTSGTTSFVTAYPWRDKKEPTTLKT
jgi:hypothetical protein